jgi:hypothetical protein
VQQQAVPQVADSIVLRPRRTTSTVLFGGLILLWVLAIAASAGANSAASSVIAASSFFGIFIAATIAGWYFVGKGRPRLEISGATIAHRKGRSRPVALSRIPGDDAMLQIIPPFSHFGVVRPAQLALLGTGGALSLAGISPDEVTQACQARDWRFGDDKHKAAATVRYLLHAGRTVEAAAFVNLFGTFAVPSDDEPGTSLDAAVFEDIGDRRFRVSRINGRDAYLRAAREQRTFAGYATSEQEKAERLAVADRIEGKARG